MKRFRGLLVVAALFAAGAAAAAAQDPSAPVFDENVVATLTLSMSATDWNTIVNDPAGQGHVWKPTTMTWQGETLTSVAVRGAVTVTLNSAGVSMVQAWVNDPASNFGVILLDSANTDGLAFASKEAATAGQRPRLEVMYAPPSAVLAWEETAPADSVIDKTIKMVALECPIRIDAI